MLSNSSRPIAPCCGVPVNTDGKGDEVPQTFFKRESSSCFCSRRDTRSTSSAWVCCTRSISLWKRQRSSRGWKGKLSGSIPAFGHSLTGAQRRLLPSSSTVLTRCQSHGRTAGCHSLRLEPRLERTLLTVGCGIPSVADVEDGSKFMKFDVQDIKTVVMQSCLVHGRGRRRSLRLGRAAVALT
jgi:hypothetical protein